jgi:hypothetical protein
MKILCLVFKGGKVPLHEAIVEGVMIKCFMLRLDLNFLVLILVVDCLDHLLLMLILHFFFCYN